MSRDPARRCTCATDDAESGPKSSARGLEGNLRRWRTGSPLSPPSRLFQELRGAFLWLRPDCIARRFEVVIQFMVKTICSPQGTLYLSTAVQGPCKTPGFGGGHKTAFNNKSKKALGSEMFDKITRDDPIWMLMSF